MFPLQHHLPYLDHRQHNPRHAGPPNRLDVQHSKLEHAKMYLNSYEIERLAEPKSNFRHEQQMTELDLQKLNLDNPLDRLRLNLSNALIGIARLIRPAGSPRRDIASAQ
jgi:hypothetical protein